MKKIISFLTSIVMTLSASVSSFESFAEDSVRIGQDEIVNTSESEIAASNSVGQLLVDAIDENEEQYEGIGAYLISDLNFIEESGIIKVSLCAVDFCTLIVAFYNNDGTELITSVSKELEPESLSAEITIDNISLPQNYLIKAYLVDENQIPLSDSYLCTDYTEEMQAIKEATIKDFESELVVNLDDDPTTNFLVLNSDTKVINSTETENILVSADYENGIYVFSNINEDISSLVEGDVIYSGSEIDNAIVDKVGSIEISDDTATITSEDTSLQEVFDFIKIESDGNDFDFEEVDTSSIENATLDSYGKNHQIRLSRLILLLILE